MDLLGQGEERFHHTFDAAPIGAALVRPDGSFSRVNPAFARYLGYEPSELIGRNFTEITHPEDIPPSRERVSQLLAGELGSFEAQKRYLRKNGATVWGRVFVTLSRTADGIPLYLQVMVVDVTSRIRNEELLRMRLQLSQHAEKLGLKDLMMAALDAAEQLTHSRIGFFHFVDPDQQHLKLQAWSTNTRQNMCQATGEGQHYPIDQAGVWVECFHTRQPVIHNDYASLPHRKGLPEGHAPVIRELVVPILRDGQVTAILGVGNKLSDYLPEDVEAVHALADLVMDIVARKRAEESLRESEMKFRAIADYTVDWETWLGNDGKPLWVSASVERITGYSPAECYLQADYPLAMVLAEDRLLVSRKLSEARSAGMAEGIEFRVLHKDGSQRWGSLAGQPILSPQGQPMGYRASIRDITAQKRMEAQLSQARRLEAIGHLAGGVAHEFNNILAAMVLNLDMLRMTRSDNSADEALTDLGTLTQRAATLVQRLLAFGQKSFLQMAPLDLTGMVEGVLHDLLPGLPGRIEISYAAAPGLPRISGDQHAIEQVILSLCLNACDAMPDGGKIQLRLELAPKANPAEAHSPQPGIDCVCLSVSDTGCGMDQATQGRIFEPFFSTKDTVHGAGLSLSAVHGIVAQHNGRIEVKSAPGQGSTFRVFFPALADSPQH